MSARLVLGSRGSRLALVQAEWVQAQLQTAHEGLTVRIEVIHTKGDKILDTPLAKIGDKGLFTKELEQALLAGGIDLAVHSAKDMPTALPEGLEIAAFTEREDVRDAFVGRGGGESGGIDGEVGEAAVVRDLAGLRQGAVVGSSSLRRRSQLLAARPDLELVDLRGNVETRLRKLQDEGLDGTVLAIAGLNRLGRPEVASFLFDFDEMLPAVGQGSLAIEVRSGDERVHALIAALDHLPSSLAVRAERALMRRLEGGCQVPIGAHGELVCGGAAGGGGAGAAQRLRLAAFVGSVDGKRGLRDQIEGPPAQPEALGEELAERLRAAGADRILAEVRGE